MKNAHLGSLEVSRIGLGAMTMAGTYTSEGRLDDAESIRTIHRALDLGVTHIDTAEIYGPFLSEEIVGQALKGRRDQVMIATKFGLVSHADGGPGVVDSSAANVRAAVEGSLKRLGTDYIDLYYQHRVDPNIPIEETAGAVADLIAEGKVLHFGLSEARRRPSAVPTPSSPFRPADRVLPVDPRPGGRDPAAAAGTRHRLRAVLPARTRPPHRPDPLGRRLRRRRLAQDQPAVHRRELPPQPRIVDEVAAIGAEIGATPAQTALAWILTRGDDIAPIPGTRRVARVEENTAAADIELTADQIQRLNTLKPASGERHDEANMASIDR